MNRVILPVFLLVLAACAGGPEPAAAPPPEPAEPITAPVPVPDPEPTLQERWRSPFAVTSSGRVAARPSLPAVRVADEADEAEADADPPATNEVRSDEALNGSVADPGENGSVDDASDEDDPADADLAQDERVAEEMREDEPVLAEPDSEADSPSEPAATPTAARATLQSHRVVQGDTWFGIARRYGISTAQLSAANPNVDPERIIIGQVVRVPGPEHAPAADQRTHEVRAGDSLWGISRRYGVTVEQLRELNRLPDERVRIGQILILPTEPDEP